MMELCRDGWRCRTFQSKVNLDELMVNCYCFFFFNQCHKTNIFIIKHHTLKDKYLLTSTLSNKRTDLDQLSVIICVPVYTDCKQASKAVSKMYLPVNPVRPNLCDWVRLRGCRSHPCWGDHGIPRQPLMLINGILTGLRLTLISPSRCCFLSAASWADQWVDDEARIVPR